MYVYCVDPAMSKSPKQLPNCLQIAETKVRSYTVTISYHCSA